MIMQKQDNTGSRLKKIALSAIKKSLKTAMKYSPDLSESQQLMGHYYWLCQNSPKAVYWWELSLATAEKLGAKTETARTCLEMGYLINDYFFQQDYYKITDSVKYLFNQSPVCITGTNPLRPYWRLIVIVLGKSHFCFALFNCGQGI